ncbi:polycystic kidney disease protein 1-like 3 [Rhipicephalus sanguineus]|uniref:polycystic kidney disease protein 1-like 3 n=1 Tax=Rhipicephalus sanguineus TaxID=34632 RepID=UPI0020C23E8A|nr:polycystic kidney disease protein 1-like 3 [Rhipicephalus sanguineus]
MEDNLPPGFPPGYTLSGNTSHSRAYDLLVKKAADLVRQEDAQRASPPRLSATTTTAKCRMRKLRDATSFLRKGEAPSTPRRTRRATKTSAFPRRTPRAKTGKAANGTNLPASIDVPPQYEATQQTAAAIFSPQTSSATAIEGAPAIPPFPKNGKGCNQGETELEENLSSLPRQESYRNTSHEFPSPSSGSQVTPAFSPPAISTAESSPTGSPPAPSAATASPPEQAREAAATANSSGALFPPAPNPDVMASTECPCNTKNKASAQNAAAPRRPAPRANASGPGETVLYRPRNRRTNFRSSTQEAISSFLATVDGVVRVRVNFRRNVVAADTPTGSPLDPLLSISDICGIAVRARQAANNTCSGIIFGIDTALGEEEIRENISSNLPVTSCSRSGHNIIVRFEGSKSPTEVALYK